MAIRVVVVPTRLVCLDEKVRVMEYKCTIFSHLPVKDPL
jgi:hypothetical protein